MHHKIFTVAIAFVLSVGFSATILQAQIGGGSVVSPSRNFVSGDLTITGDINQQGTGDNNFSGRILGQDAEFSDTNLRVDMFAPNSGGMRFYSNPLPDNAGVIAIDSLGASIGEIFNSERSSDGSVLTGIDFGTNVPVGLQGEPLNLQNTADGTTGVTINNNVAWHAGNDGAGSGLDADTLDGDDYFIAYGCDTDDNSLGACNGIKGTVLVSESDNNAVIFDIPWTTGGGSDFNTSCTASASASAGLVRTAVVSTDAANGEIDVFVYDETGAAADGAFINLHCFQLQ